MRRSASSARRTRPGQTAPEAASRHWRAPRDGNRSHVVSRDSHTSIAATQPPSSLVCAFVLCDVGEVDAGHVDLLAPEEAPLRIPGEPDDDVPLEALAARLDA